MLSATRLAVEGGSSPTTVISLPLRISVCTVLRPCLINCSEGPLVVALTLTEKLNNPSVYSRDSIDTGILGKFRRLLATSVTPAGSHFICQSNFTCSDAGKDS